MADNNNNSDKEAEPPVLVLPSTEAPKSASSWRIPTEFEDHFEAGLIKTVAGVAIGGALGVALFRTGKGWRSAATAAGLGVALGSTYERSVAPRYFNSTD